MRSYVSFTLKGDEYCNHNLCECHMVKIVTPDHNNDYNNSHKMKKNGIQKVGDVGYRGFY